jgi:peroxiredoxin
MKPILFTVMLVAVLLPPRHAAAQATPPTRIGQSLPAIALLALDSTATNLVSFRNPKQPLVVVYFSPTCSHCQHQTEEITGNMGLFKEVQFVFVSAYALPDIKTFATNYGLGRFKNIALAYDPTAKLAGYYNMQSLPGIYVYNKSGKLIHSFETNATAVQIVDALGKP